MRSEIGSLTNLRVLMVEDDLRLAQVTLRYLEAHGVDVVWSLRGYDTAASVLRWKPHVVLLEGTMSDTCGYSVCHRLRQRSDVPIIMVTERADGTDRVQGLEAGADDCITKPFSMRELLARLHVHARRALRRASASANEIHVGELRLDLGARKVFVRDRNVRLTVHEFKLLRVMGAHAGRVVSRERLLTLLGRDQTGIDRSVDVYICRLRSKLGLNGAEAPLLRTVRGVGYVLMGT